MNAHTTFPVGAPVANPLGADGERIVAALRARSAASGDDAAPAAAPALSSLIEALPSDATRAPQTEFVRDLQVLFIENLSLTGSVRSAACAAGVSHQTAYRARRSCAHFRLGWDGALVAARAAAADTLACRAIDGIEEQVFYHGDVIATRRRYSDRLLLAHMARLDRLATGDARASAFAEDWDAAMARFAGGEDPVPELAPEPASNSAPDGPEIFSPRQCNTRSMSPGADADWEEYLAEEDEYGSVYGSFEDFLDAKRQNRELRERIERERPAGAKLPEELGGDEWVRSRQSEACDVGLERWWTIVTEDDLEAAYRAAKKLSEEAEETKGEGEEIRLDEPPMEFKSVGAPGLEESPALKQRSGRAEGASALKQRSGRAEGASALEQRQFDRAVAALDQAELVGGGAADVDRPSARERPAVVDADHHRGAVRRIGDADHAAEGERAVRGGHRVHVKGFAAGGAAAVELAGVVRRDTAAENCFGGRDLDGRLDRGDIDRAGGGAGSRGQRLESVEAGGECRLGDERLGLFGRVAGGAGQGERRRRSKNANCAFGHLDLPFWSAGYRDGFPESR